MSTNPVRFSPVASLTGLAGAHVRTGLCSAVVLQQLPLPCLQSSLGHISAPSVTSEGTRANRTELSVLLWCQLVVSSPSSSSLYCSANLLAYDNCAAILVICSFIIFSSNADLNRRFLLGCCSALSATLFQMKEVFFFFFLKLTY